MLLRRACPPSHRLPWKLSGNLARAQGPPDISVQHAVLRAADAFGILMRSYCDLSGDGAHTGPCQCLSGDCNSKGHLVGKYEYVDIRAR